jgi:ribosomal protein S18 acetylase RimI-like enzyme
VAVESPDLKIRSLQIERECKMNTELKLRDYSENDNALIESVTEPFYLDKFKEFEGKDIKIILSGGTAVGWAHVHVPGSSLYSGFIFIYISPSYRRQGIGTWVYRQAVDQWIPIGSLAVDRACAGRGYGTRLAAFLTNEIIRRGNSKPCLYCELGNDNALHVYRKIGFSEVSRETVAVKN